MGLIKINELQRHREASALGGFPDLFAKRLEEKQLARHRDKSSKIRRSLTKKWYDLQEEVKGIAFIV
jgi:hypothetical protein